MIFHLPGNFKDKIIKVILYQLSIYYSEEWSFYTKGR